MARPVASYEIRADDLTRSGVASATSNVDGMVKSAAAGAAKMIASWAAVTLTFSKVVETVKKSLAAYQEVERAQIKLAAAALNNANSTVKSTKALMVYANQMEDLVGIDKSVIMSNMALLESFNLTDKQIRDVTSAAADIAASGMMGFDEAVVALGKSFSGTAGTLARSIPAIKDLTAEQLKSGAAVDMVAKQYKGLAAAVAGSSSGLSTSWDNTWGDFFEGVGKALAPLQKAVIMKLKPVLDAVNKWITDNGNAITNVFLYLPELAQVSLSFVGKAFKNAFSMEQIVNNIQTGLTHAFNVYWAIIKLVGKTFVRVGEEILQTFSSLMTAFGTIMTAVGKTLWAPLSYGFDLATYGIQVGWRAMVEGLASALNWLVSKPINAIAQAFADVINFIGPGINVVISGIVSMINVAIEGANQLSTLFKNIGTHGLDFKSWEKATPGQGAISAPTVGKVTIPTLVSDIKPKWEKALSPPENNILKDISDAWKNVGSDLGSTWDQFIASTGDIWAGFDQNLLSSFKDIWASTVGVMDNAVKPWEEAFAEVVPKFRDILGRELPLELQSSVDAVIAKIDAVKPVKGWAGFTARIQAFFNKLGSGFTSLATNFVPNLAKFGQSLLDGAVSMGNAILHPISTIKAWFEKNKDKIGDAGLAALDLGKKAVDAAPAVAAAALTGLANAAQWLITQLISLITNTQGFQDMLSFVSTALSNIVNAVVTPLIAAFQPLINILLVFIQYIAQMLLPIFNMFGTLIQAIMPIIVAVGNIILLVMGIFDQFAPIIFVIVELIASILTPILNAIMPLLQLAGTILTALMPVIVLIIKVMDVLSRPVQFVADLFTYVGRVLSVFAHNVGEVAYKITHWTYDMNIQSAGGFSSDAFTRALIDVTKYTGASTFTPATAPQLTLPTSTLTVPTTGSLDGTTVSTPTSQNNVSYTGGQTNTFNISVTTAALVGEDGFKEFVKMIIKEERELIAQNTV